MFGAVKAFEMKVKLFRKQVENVNMFVFLWLHKDGSVSVPSPRVRAVGKRFSDFGSHATNIRIF
jgi:hypothetical protein